jgi:uncharacterized protein YggE
MTYPNGGGVSAPGITVHGVGVATVVPDLATIVLGVQTKHASAGGALEENNRHARALLDALRRGGLSDTDLKTNQVSISPWYADTGERSPAYQVTNLVTATVRDVATVGAIIDAAARACGDAVRVEQLNFGVADEAPALARARADAVRHAREQAGQLASAAGVRLGRPRSITEEPRGGHPSQVQRLSRTAAGGMPIQPGLETIRVTVELVYDIDKSDSTD